MAKQRTNLVTLHEVCEKLNREPQDLITMAENYQIPFHRYTNGTVTTYKFPKQIFNILKPKPEKKETKTQTKTQTKTKAKKTSASRKRTTGKSKS